MSDGTPAPSAGMADGGAMESERNDRGASAAPGTPSASGIVLVHAAAFPAFRLCFESTPDALPQPDSKLMPEANVVGVEVGSAVRIEPHKAPGKVYVIREGELRKNVLDPPTCRELLSGEGDRALLLDRDYHVAGEIKEALGEGQVHVLAITGCGNHYDLEEPTVKVSSAICDKVSTRPWNNLAGNLETKIVPLRPTGQLANGTSLPVQLLHLAPALGAQLGAATLDVSFGELSKTGKLPQAVAAQPKLLEPSDQVTLPVDHATPAVYGTHGFRIAVREPGGAVRFSVDQSLVAVQDFSAPLEIPGTYYRVASNYVLLLLGDPATPADAGPNDRRGLHLLAVPVLDPEQVDAGAPPPSDAGASADAR